MEITILSARGWVIMGRDVGVHKTVYNTWLSCRLENQPRSFPVV